MRIRYLIGIEFEYLLTTKNDYSADGLKSYKTISVKDLATVLENRPGAGDLTLYHDSEGVKNGYWYVEGIERYSREGALVGQAVKGLEVRTPPATSIAAALNRLLLLERQLRKRLTRAGLDLAVAAYHPTAPPYNYDPPLATWEETRRRALPEYRLADIAMLTYGPDINFSLADWSESQLVTAAEKLAWFAPYISLFTLNAPFAESCAWGGLSRRTSVRGSRRPACFAFVAEPNGHPLLRAARTPTERGRFEYKAFDAAPSAHLLGACSALVLGLLLDRTLMQRCIAQPQSLYDRIAVDPFGDGDVVRQTEIALRAAEHALLESGLTAEARRLKVLETMLRTEHTPAQDALARYELTGELVHYGGLDLRRLEINNDTNPYSARATEFKNNNSSFSRAIETQCS